LIFDASPYFVEDWNCHSEGIPEESGLYVEAHCLRRAVPTGEKSFDVPARFLVRTLGTTVFSPLLLVLQRVISTMKYLAQGGEAKCGKFAALQKGLSVKVSWGV
jgi:hypothetical protein